MGNFLKMKHIFRSNKTSPTQPTEVPKRRSRILREIKRTGKTIREIFRHETNKGAPQPLDDEATAHQETLKPAEESLQQPPSNDSDANVQHNVEQSAEASIQQAQHDIGNDASPFDTKQPTAEAIERTPSNNTNEGTHHDAEKPVKVSVQQTPKTVGNDSGYSSPEDETSAWEKILEMREREHQNDLAAMQDEHDDEVKDLRKELSSEVGKKQLLQKRVKKEVLAKKDFKLQLDTLQEEHRAVVEASKNKDAEIEEKEKEALALRGRLQEIEMGFQVREISYLETLKIQGQVIKAKEEEIVDLRRRTLDLNSELLKKRVGTDARKPQVGESATNGSQWEAWYHHAFENGQKLRRELETCSRQREEAMAFATNFHTQLELAKMANGKLSAEVASKQQQIEVEGRYHEQIRGQNYDLQKRVNESVADAAQLKYKKAKAEQEAAEDVKDLTRKLDNRTAELSALEATRAEWQADPEGVLLTPSEDVTIKALILALAKRFELSLNENDSLEQRMSVREQEYDALNKQLRHTKAQRDGLSESLAEKDSDITALKDKIHDLETEILRREMNDEADKRAEPGYLQAMEEVAWLQTQLKDQAHEHAAAMANVAADGPRKAIQNLQHICRQVSADNEALQQTLNKERTERYYDNAVVGNHILALNGQIENAGAYKQRAVDAEKVWDRVRELEQHAELDRVARSKSDAMTLQIRAELEEQVAKKESEITQLLEEVQRLREAASENEESGNSRALVAQRDQARRVALQNRQQHVAKVEKLKDLIEELYLRLLRLEATLVATGRVIQEADDDGDALKARCRRVLGYDDTESESDDEAPVHTGSGPATDNPSDAEHESGDENDAGDLPDRSPSSESEVEAASPAASNTGLGSEPANQLQHDSNPESEAETEHSSESSTTITVRRFVMRSLAEGGTRIRVLGESSSPAATPTPENHPPMAEDGEVILSDGDDGSEDDGSGDLQPYHPPPFPVASMAWVKEKRPFAYGEPVGDDQFGKEALRARR